MIDGGAKTPSSPKQMRHSSGSLNAKLNQAENQ